MKLYDSDYGKVYQGDCLEIMKSLPGNSIETCISDLPAGISFMGKPWDSHRGGRDKWIAWAQERFSEVLRILKPGGLAFVWAFPRTAHWPATALENAGFEIINKSYFLFGAGWPKGLDISKGIDKHFGCVREKRGLKIHGDGKPTHEKKSNCHEGYRRPWMDKPIEEQNCLYESEPVHPLAQLWNGWNSQLKPMCEEWIIGMKPLDGTFTENALKWGVAGYNIGECRIPIDKDERRYDLEPQIQNENYTTSGGSVILGRDYKRTFSKGIQNMFQKGRYPGNIVIDDEVAKELDERFGERKSGKLKAGTRNKAKSIFKLTDDYKGHEASAGGASRFFTRCNWEPTDFYFSGKACQSEKNMGCDKIDGGNKENFFPKERGKISKTKNAHPTVKSIQFMRWLCRLSKTPTGGTIIDPFAGTYSTLIAAYLEGRKFIGIELEPEYNETGMARLKEAMGLFFEVKNEL